MNHPRQTPSWARDPEVYEYETQDSYAHPAGYVAQQDPTSAYRPEYQTYPPYYAEYDPYAQPQQAVDVPHQAEFGSQQAQFVPQQAPFASQQAPLASRQAQAGVQQTVYGPPDTASGPRGAALGPTEAAPRASAHRQPEAPPAAPKAEPEPSYTLPEVPESAWSVDTRRSKLLGRGVLVCILMVQAGLSLRLRGTAFQDEALYIAAGHYELDNLVNGTKTPVDFAAYFSGHPKLYPVLAALVDTQFGLTGVRVMSLLFMLAATGLLYSLTRRLFNLRAGLGAAALFSVLQSTMVLGNFATYDAAAIFLLALSAYAVVRTDRMKSAAVLLAAPPAALAFAVKYASGLYLPTLVLLAVITAHRHRGVGALGRGVVLGGGIGALLGAGYFLAGPVGGISSTTTDRARGTDTAATMLQHSAEWGGLVFLAALFGTIGYTLRGRMGEMPWIAGITPGRWRRAALGVLLTGTALLAPAYQIHLQTEISLYKHVGFGLFFAAPMAGLGMARLVGPHFRHPQLGIMLYVLTLVFGMVQAQRAYSFPDSAPMIAFMRDVVDKKGRYLAEEQEVPGYYLRDVTRWEQWQNSYVLDYRGKSGPDAFRQAVRDGYFDAIVMHGRVSPDTFAAVKQGLKGNTHYRLAAVLPFTTSGGDSAYRIWVKR
ncbi:ArnT family glycosyltransferase [Streptomyces cavernae]|uniref:ArnT family glycosyltransferase n=1 Tax=Streptomyces cavernae TaxID=2259034 RepID=UPI001EE40EDF|nr:glycosyltransferase family 39 protein [Streptomyces cavernae]